MMLTFGQWAAVTRVQLWVPRPGRELREEAPTRVSRGSPRLLPPRYFPLTGPLVLPQVALGRMPGRGVQPRRRQSLHVLYRQVRRPCK
jgi:hypothetical protein